MVKPVTDPADIPERPTIYRSVSAVLGGFLVLLLCVIGVVDLLANGYLHWRFIACATLLAVLAFVFGPYPAAFSDAHRLVVRNPFRRIVLPWPRVVGARAGLSMTINDENEGHYTVWAIPVSMRARRKVDRAQYRMVAIARREDARAKRGAAHDFEPTRPRRGGATRFGGFGGDQTGLAGGQRPDQAYADQAEQELEARRTACTDAHDDTTPVQAGVTWWTIALCTAAAVFVVVAFAA